MKREIEDLLNEIRSQDQKMQLLSKPFGGYKNILHIDDIYFDDPYISKDLKQYFKVSEREKHLQTTFNMIATRIGMKDTRWARLTIILFGIWTMATAFVCFEKADFLNLTLGIIGLFMFLDPQ